MTITRPKAADNDSNPTNPTSGIELAVFGKLAACRGEVSKTLLTGSSSPLGSSALRRAFSSSATGRSAGDVVMSGVNSVGIEGTGSFITLANSTALSFGYTNSCPDVSPGWNQAL